MKWVEWGGGGRWEVYTCLESTRGEMTQCRRAPQMVAALPFAAHLECVRRVCVCVLYRVLYASFVRVVLGAVHWRLGV